jgi:hypothetical protein
MPVPAGNEATCVLHYRLKRETQVALLFLFAGGSKI